MSATFLEVATKKYSIIIDQYFIPFRKKVFVGQNF